MKAQEFKDLLKRYSESTLTEAEELQLKRWYDSYDTEEFTGFTDEAHASRIKAEMFAVIAPEPKTFRLWKHLLRAEHLNRLIGSAAVLFLIIAVWMWIGKPINRSVQNDAITSYTIFTTKAAERKQLTLADNSIVHLGPSSTLKVAANYAKQHLREVFLEDGNAFFEVSKDPSHPFIVHTSLVSTRVLGTKFKVSNNRADSRIEVSLSEGKVQVSNQKKVLANLLPGKKLVYHLQTSTWQKSDFGTSENNEWYKVVKDLNHADFDEVAKVVKLYYGVNIRCINPNSASYQYNLQMRSEHTLAQTLKIICSVHHNKYRRDGNGIIIY